MGVGGLGSALGLIGRVAQSEDDGVLVEAGKGQEIIQNKLVSDEGSR